MAAEVKVPTAGRRNILITSALPYVNNVPHLGNIIGCVLSGDVFARYCRLRDYNVIYVCGTDEYGTATETRAREEGVTPKELCNKYHAIHKRVYEWFDCSFDIFGRTTTEQQTHIAQNIFHKLNANDLLVEKEVSQLYCEKCERFLADRYVRGTCPFCAYDGARGDQCDKCQKLLDPTELINPKCHTDGTQPVERSTTHLFLKLPELTERLKNWVDQSSQKGFWSPNSVQMTHGWLKNGLTDRCITRDLKWGTPVPIEKFKHKVFYVWFDAPIGYISITANYAPHDWEQWWKNPENVELFQFMGKDNVPFHTVIFPSSLLGSGDNWTLLHHLSTTEYLTYEGRKFTKSGGVGVFGDHAMQTNIPAEIWRYYLLVNRPEQSDSDFTWDDFKAKTNNELLKNLGNFINRALMFIKNNLHCIIPPATFCDEDQKIIEAVNGLIRDFAASMEKVHIKEALKIIMEISQIGNKFLQDNKPWELGKSDPVRCGTVLSLAANFVFTLSILMEPFMPQLSSKILAQLNLPPCRLRDDMVMLTVPEGHEISHNIAPLIQKLEDKVIEALKEKFAGAQASMPPCPLDIRVGRIEGVQALPDSDKLYVMKVNVGSSVPRTVVAGLRAHYTQEELEGKGVCVLCNLKPAKLKGVKSEGMCLACKRQDGEGPLGLLFVPEAQPGEKICPQDMRLVPAAPSKFDLNQFKKPENSMHMKEGRVVFGETHVLQTEKGVLVTVDRAAGAGEALHNEAIIS